MSEIDWKLCQKASAEELRCPSHNPTPAYNPLDANNAFVINFQEFKWLNLLPVKMELEENGLEQKDSEKIRLIIRSREVSTKTKTK